MLMTIGYNGSLSTTVCIEPTSDVGFGECGASTCPVGPHTHVSRPSTPMFHHFLLLQSRYVVGLAFCSIISPEFVDLEEDWSTCVFCRNCRQNPLETSPQCLHPWLRQPGIS